MNRYEGMTVDEAWDAYMADTVASSKRAQKLIEDRPRRLGYPKPKRLVPDFALIGAILEAKAALSR